MALTAYLRYNILEVGLKLICEFVGPMHLLVGFGAEISGNTFSLNVIKCMQ